MNPRVRRVGCTDSRYRGGTEGCEGWDVRIAGTGVGPQDARDGMYGYLAQGWDVRMQGVSCMDTRHRGETTGCEGWDVRIPGTGVKP